MRRVKRSVLSIVPHLAEDFIPELNAGVDLANEGCSSLKSVIWRCHKCGYEWKSAINSRVNRRKDGEGYYIHSCPSCAARKKIHPIKRSVLSAVPELTEDFVPELNVGVDLANEGCSSHKSVIWRCHKCGHEWKSPIYYRTKRRKDSEGNYNIRPCPACSGNEKFQPANKKIVLSVVPNLIEDFDPELNPGIDLTNEGCSSVRSVIWRCHKCGYEWESAINSRVRREKDGEGYYICSCPSCAARKNNHSRTRSVISDIPGLIDDFAPELNAGIDPANEGCCSHKSVIWRCHKCGHEWKSPIYYRTKRRKDSEGNYNIRPCPACSDNKKFRPIKQSVQSAVPDLAEDFVSELNVGVDLANEGCGSHKSVIWRCHKCGHEWKSPICYRVNRRKDGEGYFTRPCPACSSSEKFQPSNKRNVLSVVPHLAEDFVPELNVGVDLANEGCSSHKSVIWRCHKCGYEWKSAINSRVNRRKDGEEYYIRSCPVCVGNKRIRPIVDDFPELAKLYDKSNQIPIEKIPAVWQKSYTWKCPNPQHPSFKSTISTMVHAIKTGNTGCPYCSKKKTVPEESFGAKHPELLNEWAPENKISPYETAEYSCRKILWKCTEGHSWYATPGMRAKGYKKCPECSTNGRSKKLIDYFPDSVDFYSSDNTVPLESISFRSTQKYIWECNYGHLYEDSADHIYIRGRIACPVCENRLVIPGTNDLATMYPEIAAEYSTDNSTPVNEVSIVSKDVSTFWTCPQGHKFTRSVAFHIESNGSCPVCTRSVLRVDQNNLATAYPQIARLWDPSMNLKLPTETLDTTDEPISLIYDEGDTNNATVDQSLNSKCTCPTCTNRFIDPRNKSSAIRHPRFIRKWSAQNDYIPERAPKSRTKHDKWICLTCGGTFETSRRKQTLNDKPCPYCSGKRVLPGFNSLKDTHPELAAEWSDQNDCGPENVLKSSTKRVKWNCHTCGGSFIASPSERELNDNRCPYCKNKRPLAGYNTLAAEIPELTNEWCVPENMLLGISADSVLPKSSSIAWWKCTECQKKYQMRINDRVLRFQRGLDICPQCEGRIKLQTHTI